MRVVIAVMKHETNTFSPVPTDIARFARGGRSDMPMEGQEAYDAFKGTGSGLADANMEVWALGKEEAYNTWMCSPTRTNDCIEQSDNGYTGKTGIYATARDESFLSSSYALDYWQSYTAGSAVLDLVPPADFLQSETSVCSEAHCSSDGRCVSLARHLYHLFYFFFNIANRPKTM